MPRNFNLSELKWKDPRVAMRAVLGILLLANLVAAVIAFKPFGGGAGGLLLADIAIAPQRARSAPKGLEGDVGGANLRDLENAQNRAHRGARYFPHELGSVRL